MSIKKLVGDTLYRSPHYQAMQGLHHGRNCQIGSKITPYK